MGICRGKWVVGQAGGVERGKLWAAIRWAGRAACLLHAAGRSTSRLAAAPPEPPADATTRVLCLLCPHLINLGGVVLLNVAQDLDVVVLHKVDGHTLRSGCVGRAQGEGLLWDAHS